jgi:hypothetical protein
MGRNKAQVEVQIFADLSVDAVREKARRFSNTRNDIKE